MYYTLFEYARRVKLFTSRSQVSPSKRALQMDGLAFRMVLPPNGNRRIVGGLFIFAIARPRVRTCRNHVGRNVDCHRPLYFMPNEAGNDRSVSFRACRGFGSISAIICDGKRKEERQRSVTHRNYRTINHVTKAHHPRTACTRTPSAFRACIRL